MGKQVNYEMNYDNFLRLAQYALDIGCLILRNDHSPEKQSPCQDISVVTPDCNIYYFYIPELFAIEDIKQGIDKNGRYYYADTSFSAFSLALIEAGFSNGINRQARVYVTTGYYDEDGIWNCRPDLLSKTYSRIARKAKQLAQKVF